MHKDFYKISGNWKGIFLRGELIHELKIISNQNSILIG